MSDSDFLDIGDELILKISGYPVGKARVDRFQNDQAIVILLNHPGNITFAVPLNVKDFDTVDGVAHRAAPLTEDGVHYSISE